MTVETLKDVNLDRVQVTIIIVSSFAFLFAEEEWAADAKAKGHLISDQNGEYNCTFIYLSVFFGEEKKSLSRCPYKYSRELIGAKRRLTMWQIVGARESL